MYLKNTSLFAICLLFVINVRAQEKENNLDPVTITATLNPVASSKTGRNLFVIKGEDLARFPVHSVDDMLRYLPGLEVQARGPMGAQSDLVVRGGTFQQVLVIIDGLRVNDPNTGHFSSYIPVTPSEIERIEILKGASSAIYGSDAVGGVIHIITKTFAQQKAAARGFQAGVTSGAYGLLNANAGGYYNSDKWSFSAGALSNNADGQAQRGINGFFHLHTFSASAGYRFNDNWQVAYRSSYDTRRFAAQNFYSGAPTDTATEKVNTLWNQLSVHYHKGNNRFSLQTGYKAVDDHYVFNKVATANNSHSALWQALATYEHSFNDRVNFTGGAQYQRKSISSNDRGDHTVQQAAAFALLNLQPGTSFTISPAIRLDWDERSGYELVPQINTSYRYGKLLLRASAGKTIRNADFTERYNYFNKATVSNGSRIGNPDLNAERSFSYEAGADFFAGKELKIAATFFQRRNSDLIDWTNTAYANMPRKSNLSPGDTYALATNIAKVNTTGAEADIIWQHSFTGKQTLSATAGFVWLNSVSSDGIVSFYTSSHAKYLTTAMLRYANSPFDFTINGIYKVRSARSVTAFKDVNKEYFLLNTKAGYFIIKDKLAVFAEADNVFNTSYIDLSGAQMPGRWLMGGITLKL
jgi:iron complex outermembrane receptor protein